jgi:hypothetical protein
MAYLWLTSENAASRHIVNKGKKMGRSYDAPALTGGDEAFLPAIITA